MATRKTKLDVGVEVDKDGKAKVAAKGVADAIGGIGDAAKDAKKELTDLEKKLLRLKKASGTSLKLGEDSTAARSRQFAASNKGKGNAHRLRTLDLENRRTLEQISLENRLEATRARHARAEAARHRKAVSMLPQNSGLYNLGSAVTFGAPRVFKQQVREQFSATDGLGKGISQYVKADYANGLRAQINARKAQLIEARSGLDNLTRAINEYVRAEYNAGLRAQIKAGSARSPLGVQSDAHIRARLAELRRIDRGPTGPKGPQADAHVRARLAELRRIERGPSGPTGPPGPQFDAHIRARSAAARAEQRAADRAAAQPSRAAGFASGVGRTALGFAAGFVGLKTVQKAAEGARDIVKFNSEIEQLKLGVAETISIAGRFTDPLGNALPLAQQISLSFADSRDAISKMLEDSIKIGVPVQALATGYTVIAGLAKAAGFNQGQSVQFMEGMAVLGQRLGVNANLLTRELDNIVTGQRVQQTILGRILGLSEQDIKNARKRGELAEFLLGKLEIVNTLLPKNLETWEGITTAIGNVGRAIASEMGEGVFEEVKRGATDFLGLLTEIRGSDTALAIKLELKNFTGLTIDVIEALFHGGVTALNIARGTLPTSDTDSTLMAGVKNASNMLFRADPFNNAGDNIGDANYYMEMIRKRGEFDAAKARLEQLRDQSAKDPSILSERKASTLNAMSGELGGLSVAPNDQRERDILAAVGAQPQSASIVDEILKLKEVAAKARELGDDTRRPGDLSKPLSMQIDDFGQIADELIAKATKFQGSDQAEAKKTIENLTKAIDNADVTTARRERGLDGKKARRTPAKTAELEAAAERLRLSRVKDIDADIERQFPVAHDAPDAIRNDLEAKREALRARLYRDAQIEKDTTLEDITGIKERADAKAARAAEKASKKGARDENAAIALKKRLVAGRIDIYDSRRQTSLKRLDELSRANQGEEGVAQARLSILQQENAPLQQQVELMQRIHELQLSSIANEKAIAAEAKSNAETQLRAAEARLANSAPGSIERQQAKLDVQKATRDQLDAAGEMRQLEQEGIRNVLEYNQALDQTRAGYDGIARTLDVILGRQSLQGILDQATDTGLRQLSRQIGGTQAGSYLNRALGGTDAPQGQGGGGGQGGNGGGGGGGGGGGVDLQRLSDAYRGYQSGGYAGALKGYAGLGGGAGTTGTGAAGQSIMTPGTDGGYGYASSQLGGSTTTAGGTTTSVDAFGTKMAGPQGSGVESASSGTGTGAAGGGIGAMAWVGIAFKIAETINDFYEYGRTSRAAVEQAKNRPGVRQSDLIAARTEGIPIVGSYFKTGNTLTNNLFGKKTGARVNNALLTAGMGEVFGMFQVPGGETQASRQIAAYAKQIGFDSKLLGGKRGVNLRDSKVPVSSQIRGLRPDMEAAGQAFASSFADTQLPEQDRVAGRTANYLTNYAAALRLSGEDAKKYVVDKFAQPLLGQSIEESVLNNAALRGRGKLTDRQFLGQAKLALDVFSDLPKAIDASRLSLELLDKNGTVQLEHLKRTVEATKEVVSGGLQDTFDSLVQSSSPADAARALGKRFSSELLTTVTNAMLRRGDLGKLLTEASTETVRAGDLFGAGDVAGGNAALNKALRLKSQGDQLLLRQLTPIANAYKSADRRFLGAGSAGGVENQTGYGLPGFATGSMKTVPGGYNQPMVAVVHGQERIYNGVVHDSLISEIRGMRSELHLMGGGSNRPMVYQPNLHATIEVDGRALANSIRLNTVNQRVGIARADSRMGVSR